MRKSLGLWVLLIVLFVAFYNLYSTPAATQQGQTHSSQGWVTWAVLGAVVLAIVLYVRHAQKKVARTHEGVRFLREGRYAQALEVFESVRLTNKKDPTLLYNCAVTRLHLWQLENARRDFEAVKAMKGEKAAIVTLLPEHLALAYVLSGRLGEATRELATVPADKGEPGRLTLVTALVLLRSGEAAGARAKLASFEVKQLGGAMGTLARTAEAFCIEHLSGEKRHVDRIALFGETGPEGLRKGWPELIDFVERAPAW